MATVTAPRPLEELALAYEVLRAQATGALPSVTPRGLALLLTAGVPAWLQAWAPVAPAAPAFPVAPTEGRVPVAAGDEVVQVLTEMALGCQRRGTAP